MEVRRADTGEVVYRDHLSCAVAAILRADYRNDGMEQVVACGAEGEVGWRGRGRHRGHLARVQGGGHDQVRNWRRVMTRERCVGAGMGRGAGTWQAAYGIARGAAACQSVV